MSFEENPACGDLADCGERKSRGEPCPAWCDGDHPVFRKHVSSGHMCYIDFVMGGPDVGTTDVREVGSRVVIGQLPTGWPKLNQLPLDALHLGEALARLAYTAMDDRRSTVCESCSKAAP